MQQREADGQVDNGEKLGQKYQTDRQDMHCPTPKQSK